LSFGKIWQFGAVNGGYRLRAPYKKHNFKNDFIWI